MDVKRDWGDVPPPRDDLPAGEELGPCEESGASLKAIHDGRLGDESDLHRRILLRHDSGRKQHSSGELARVYQGLAGASM